MTFIIFYALLALQEVQVDQAYGEHKKQKMDLYLPEKAEGAAVLMFVHGGTWKHGDKGTYSQLGKAGAKNGYVTAVINYRLTPEVKHPGHIEDVAGAFGWLRKKYPKSKMFIAGHSAGGHLVALLATNEKYLRAQGCSTRDIAGVIGISGVYHILPDPKILPEVFTEDPEIRKDASPAEFVREGLPRFLVLYGDKDMAQLIPSAKEFYKALQEKKVESELLECKDRDHITIISKLGREDDEATKKILEFLGPAH